MHRERTHWAWVISVGSLLGAGGVHADSVSHHLGIEWNYPSGQLVVEAIRPSSAAALAQFKKGDLLLAVENISVTTPRLFEAVIKTYAAGVTLKVHLSRQTTALTLRLALPMEDLPEPKDHIMKSGEIPPEPSFGVTGGLIWVLDPDRLVVAQVEPASWGEWMGLKPGDVIKDVNKASVISPEEFSESFLESEWTGTHLRIHRKGKYWALRKKYLEPDRRRSAGPPATAFPDHPQAGYTIIHRDHLRIELWVSSTVAIPGTRVIMKSRVTALENHEARGNPYDRGVQVHNAAGQLVFPLDRSIEQPLMTTRLPKDRVSTYTDRWTIPADLPPGLYTVIGHEWTGGPSATVTLTVHP